MDLKTNNNIYNQNQDFDVAYNSQQNLSDDDKYSQDFNYNNVDSSDNKQYYNISNSLDQSMSNDFDSDINIDKNKQFYVENSNE